MRAFRQIEKFDLEAGGVLLGRCLLNSEDVVVDQVTIPQPGDKRRRFRFFRKNRTHQRLIEKVWRESGGTCNYIGEWHTHPEKKPIPSSFDLTNWKIQVEKARFEGDSLFFVIIGIEAFRVFEIFKSDLSIHILSPNSHQNEP